MLSYMFKRLLQGVFVVIGISILIFIISRIIPGDPARMALGPRAPQFAVDELKKEMHFDKPITVQYLHWFKGLLKGDFGKSLNTKRPVLKDIKDFFPATLELVLFSGILLIVFSIIFGLLSTKYRDTWIDSVIRVFSYIGISTPAFVRAALLLLIFGYLWKLFPVFGRVSTGISIPKRVTGMLTIDSLIAGDIKVFYDSLKHLLLPSIALTAGPIFQEARIIRSSLIDNMNKEYIAMANAHGIPKDKVLVKYLLKPSFIPVVSVMGLDIAQLMGDAFLVETIFCWPGISRYGINAMLNKDLNAISAVIVIIGVIFLVVNIIVDLVIAWIDPRVRLGDDK